LNWKQKTFALDLVGAKQYLVDANISDLKQTFLKLTCSFCHNSTIMKQILEEEVYNLITNFSSSFVHEEENGSHGFWMSEPFFTPFPFTYELIPIVQCRIVSYDSHMLEDEVRKEYNFWFVGFDGDELLVMISIPIEKSFSFWFYEMQF